MKIRMRDGTGMADLRYLTEETDRHGNVRIYVRRRGQRIRLRDEPGTQEFMDAYKAALAGTQPDRPKKTASPSGSFRALLTEYYTSAAFTGELGKRTQYVRRGLLDGIAETEGDKPYRLMLARHVERIRDQKREVPEAGNGRIKALRHFGEWAKKAQYHSHNPAKAVDYIRTGSDGHHTWTVEEIEQYEERWPVGTKERLAMAVLLFTGVRRSDAVRLGPQMERGETLHFTETKGRTGKLPKRRELPILPELRTVLDGTKFGHLAYLVTAFNKPFTTNGFGNWFRKACNAAGLPHCSAHGLRKAGATIAADRGATEYQLMAIYDWESPKQAALYTRKANRKKLTKDAIHMIVPEQKTDRRVSLSGGVEKGEATSAKKRG